MPPHGTKVDCRFLLEDDITRNEMYHVFHDEILHYPFWVLGMRKHVSHCTLQNHNTERNQFCIRSAELLKNQLCIRSAEFLKVSMQNS